MQRMALELDCPAAFALSDWVDVRLSRGEAGSFLYIQNYADDPIETTVAWQGEPLCGGQPIVLPARQGAILPLDWHAAEGVVVHYATAEVRAVERGAGSLIFRLAHESFAAELGLSGWGCAGAELLPGTVPPRLRLHGRDGRIVLHREGTALS